MPPVPARIASTPRQSSRTCWNPAVPPPPVLGAAAGNELADGLGDCGGLGLGVVTLGVVTLCVVVLGVVVLGVVVLGAEVLGVVVLGVPLEVAPPGVSLAEPVGPAALVSPAEKEGGVVGVEPDEQADTDAVASTARAAQPRTVPRKRRRS
jgi:hypothetical protein